jgi:hypothetical protein
MPGVEISLVHGPVSMIRDGLRVVLNGTPEAGHPTIKVIDGFDFWFVRSPEQNSTGSEERLDVIPNVAEVCPDNIRNLGFSTEPRKGCPQFWKRLCRRQRNPPSPKVAKPARGR